MADNNPDPADIPEFDRVMRGLVGVNPKDVEDSAVNDSKIRAEFQVVDRINNSKLSDRTPGLIHLFEQEYRDLSFWHGVATVDGHLSYNKPKPSLGWSHAVNVYLEDGRAGQCHLLTMREQGGASGEYHELQLVGISGLRAIEVAPHFSPTFD